MSFVENKRIRKCLTILNIMLKKVKKWVAIILTTSVVFMTLLAILAIWGVFDNDIALKAVSTLGVILAASAISLVIIRIVDDKDGERENQI